MTELTVCTIVSANYLPFARVLAGSLRDHHPQARFVVLLVDRVGGRFDPTREPFEVIAVEDLPTLDDPHAFLFKYTVLEANTAVKPYLLQHLLERSAGRVVYLDPDIQLFAPLSRIEELLGEANVVLTPHLTAPIDDGRMPDELAVLRSGAYNLGFLALADGEPTRSFLAWWQDRIFDRCVVRVEQGLFVDQKWIDLVPGMVPGVRILTDPGYNVAYWNLHERRVRLGERPEVNGRPLVFFHFSGIDLERPEVVSRHQDRYRLSELGDVAVLFDRYIGLVKASGWAECAGWRYAFSSFDDGTPIPDAARDLYRTLGPGRRRFGDPFAVADGFRAWLNLPYGAPPSGLSRLLHHLWTSRPDLQGAFPDPAGRDLEAFARWLEDYGVAEYELPRTFREPVAAALARGSAGRRLARAVRRAVRGVYVSAAARRLKEAVKGRLGADRAAALKRLGRPLAVGEAARFETVGRYRPAPRELPAGVNVIGYLRTESGVGESARCLVRGLRAAGVSVSLSDLDLGVRSRREDHSVDGDPGAADHAVNLLVVNADQVEVVARHLGPERFAGHLNVGFWAWELEEFPDEWRPAFRYFDELWTHSRFCQDAFSSVSPVPVRRVPLPVVPQEGVAADRAEFGIDGDAFVVLTIFDFLSFFDRKNPLGLVEAFRRALADRKDAVLVVKTANSGFAPDRLAELERAAQGLNVRLLDRTFDRDAVWRLMACCDAYGSLHRAEGYGLTLLEAMALGKPVLATSYSGNTDFMNPANSLPVGYRLALVARDEGPYRQGRRWAEPDLDHAAELLRRLYEDREWGRRIGTAARETVATNHSPEAVAEPVRLRLASLLERRPRSPSRSLAWPPEAGTA